MLSCVVLMALEPPLKRAETINDAESAAAMPSSTYAATVYERPEARAA
jgi:hypothetical protein